MSCKGILASMKRKVKRTLPEHNVIILWSEKLIVNGSAHLIKATLKCQKENHMDECN